MTSAALHAALAGFMLVQWTGGSASYEVGDGDDLFATESGITLEGIGFGNSLNSVAAVEEQMQESSVAQPEIKEVKAPEVVEERPDEVLEELPEDNEVITSTAEDAPALEAEPVLKEDEPVVEEKPREAQVATLEQVQQAALKEEIRAGAKQRGGNPDARRKYLGKLRQHLERKKINPRSRRTGTVVVRFSVGREGEIITREVVTSSGSSVLDKAAVASIDKAAPFPVRPQDMSDEPLVVSVPFRFSVRRR
jgi:periplasmic protein TonB